MKPSALALAVFGLSMLAGTSSAQEAAGSAYRIEMRPGVSPMLARMQARGRVRATALRQAWLASGRTVSETVKAPSITAGKILTPSLNVDKAPATPAINVTYKTGAPGIYGIFGWFYSETTGQYLYVDGYSPYATPSTHGSITFEDPNDRVSLYAAPGAWTLEYLEIDDQAGNYTDYSGDQLAALFPSLTITVTNNGTPDVTAPTVTAGKILTKTVSLSSTRPYFEATLTGADAGSGIYYASAFVMPPGETTYGYGGDAEPPAPLKKGSVTSYLNLAGFTTTGDWTIYGYEMCDVAGNCLYDFSSTDVQALFGTTSFTVTN